MSLNSGETLQPFKALNQLIFDSSGNLIGIQNDRAVGNDLRIGGGSGVDGTFATLIATTALKLNSGATFDLYNTADQTTNYERLRADWSSNVARLYVQSAGTGIDRDFRVGAATLYHVYQQRTSTSPLISATFTSSVTSTLAAGVNQLFSGTVTAASGTQTPVSIAPTINQSGTAGYTALDINPTETATGSGTTLLQRWAVGGSAKAQLSSTGVFGTSGLLAGSSSTIGFSSDFTLVGQDVSLNRDAADALALRRGASAQNFRMYNTYTDASNYERGIAAWISSNFVIGTQNAGTGSVRNMRLMAGGTERWEINSGNGFLFPIATDTYDLGVAVSRIRSVFSRQLMIADGITAPSATADYGTIYIDSADGDLKIIFGDGTIKTIVTDT